MTDVIRASLLRECSVNWQYLHLNNWSEESSSFQLSLKRFFDLLHRRRRRRSHRHDILVQYGSDVVGGHGGRVAQQQLWGQRQVWWKQRWTQQAESAHR